MAINQADIIDGGVVFTNLDPYKINPGAELEGTTTATAFALGSSGSTPLQIKTTGVATNTGWTDEQDVMLSNVAITTSTPVLSVTASVGMQLVTLSITTGTVVGLYGPGAWASSATMNSSHTSAGGTGSYNATIISGGTSLSVTELFNGSGWINSNNMTTTRASFASMGSQNAAIAACGSANASSSTSEIFNGVNWTLSGNTVLSRVNCVGAGSQNAGFVSGGVNNVATSNTEFFNGSTWSTSANLNTTIATGAATGSQFASIIIGGGGGGGSNTEIFNGISWYAGATLIVARSSNSAFGTLNSAATGGNALLNTSITELFNGANWIASGNNVTIRGGAPGSGTQVNGLMMGSGTSTEAHTQTTYRAMTWDNIRCATNIGVATNIVGNVANVKMQGFVQNMSISNTAGSYLVINRNSSTTASTASYQTFKTFPEAEDWVVGVAQTVTTSLSLINNPVLTFDEVKNWG